MAVLRSPPRRPREMNTSKGDRVASAASQRPATPYDALPEESFDRAARLTAGSLHAPIAIVSLLHQDRHVVKSCVGFTARSRAWRKVPLALRFARQAVSSGRPVVISDVGEAVVAGSISGSAVKSPDGVAYAVAPLVTSDG